MSRFCLKNLCQRFQGYFGSRDYLNFAYFVKRAHYLCTVAAILKEAGLNVKFTLDEHDRLKPLLLVSGTSTFSKSAAIECLLCNSYPIQSD